MDKRLVDLVKIAAVSDPFPSSKSKVFPKGLGGEYPANTPKGIQRRISSGTPTHKFLRTHVSGDAVLKGSKLTASELAEVHAARRAETAAATGYKSLGTRVKDLLSRMGKGAKKSAKLKKLVGR